MTARIVAVVGELKLPPNLKPKPKPDAGSKKLIVISLGCALVSVASSIAAARQPKPPISSMPSPMRQSNPLSTPPQEARARSCGPDLPGISNYPSAIRGTTKVAPWLLFDQRKQMNLVRLTPIAAPGIPGGRAETIVIPRRETQAYFIGASMRNQRPIARGDNIVAEIWLRAEATANANQPVVIEARIQEDGNGYRNLTTSQLSLTSSFTKFEVRARADQNFCPEELNFALHLATGHQTIDIGPATLKVIP